MDFSLSKEQQDIAKAARTFAASEFPENHPAPVGGG